MPSTPSNTSHLDDTPRRRTQGPCPCTPAGERVPRRPYLELTPEQQDRQILLGRRKRLVPGEDTLVRQPRPVHPDRLPPGPRALHQRAQPVPQRARLVERRGVRGPQGRLDPPGLRRAGDDAEHVLPQRQKAPRAGRGLIIYDMKRSS